MDEVSIIGAGIGGLTLGNILKQRNMNFTIYESAPEIKPVGAGIMMAINAMQIFDQLNVKGKIENAGNKIHGISITDESLKPILKTNALKLEKKYNSCNVAIHRAELQKILAEKIGFEHIKLNHTLIQIQKKENYILTFDNKQEIESKIIFGADGIKSKVRDQIIEPGKIRNAEQICWRGLVEFDLPESFHQEAFEAWGKAKRFGFVKISRKKVYWYALTNKKKFDDTINLIDIFKNFHPIILKILEATPLENIIINDIIDLSPISKWHSENLCLIGDAAHATTPNMGQGACQSIEDAYIIGKLMDITDNINEVFEKFQSIRRKKVDYIVETSWKIGKISQWEKGNSVRNFLMRLVPEKMNQQLVEKIIKLEK
ncbi:FAD-dependent monooxygenase [Chryseobacterium daeguense]|uniref:FAD-dependent monooxygenase n=1 Tax=Chryseobacterium daeguense TaxID=412438 RepID=UPI0003FC093D|nr:FAD-dependent monooxygenase [Chryseobacterium daeguense]